MGREKRGEEERRQTENSTRLDSTRVGFVQSAAVIEDVMKYGAPGILPIHSLAYGALPVATERRKKAAKRDKYPIKGRLETLLENCYLLYISVGANELKRRKRGDENGQETRPFNITRNRYDSIRHVIGDIGDAYRRDTHPTNSRKAFLDNLETLFLSFTAFLLPPALLLILNYLIGRSGIHLHS